MSLSAAESGAKPDDALRPSGSPTPAVDELPTMIAKLALLLSILPIAGLALAKGFC